MKIIITESKLEKVAIKWLNDNYGDLMTSDGDVYQSAKRIKESKSKGDQKVYQEWIKLVGGEKNVFLRDFLKNFRLA
jgi:hypothetical protein